MKLREIERLRATAILMVMVVHWPPLGRFLPAVFRESWSGVDLFFVISGYVVALSLLRMMPALEAESSFGGALQRASAGLQAFYVRRFFRIMPAAVTVMLAFRVLACFIPQKFGPTGQWWIEVFAFLGGVYNYAHAFHHDYKLGVYWSLAVEEHFYLVLPLLLVACRSTRSRLAACAGIACFSIVARFVSQPPTDPGVVDVFYYRFGSHLRFDSLMAGVGLALLRRPPPEQPLLPPRFVRWLVVPAVLALVATLPAVMPDGIASTIGFVALWGLSAIAVAYAGQDRGYVLEVPGLRRVLEYLGSRSYALYLVHVGVGRLEDVERHAAPPIYLMLAPDNDAPWGRVAVVLTATLLVAEVLHRAVERPMIRLGKRLIDEPGRPVPVPVRVKVAGVAAIVGVAIAWFRHPLLLAFGATNVARGAAVYASSHLEGKPPPSALTNGELEPEFGLHTTDEKGAWATVDLGHEVSIGAVRVYNRDDGYQADEVPIDLQVSADDVEYRTLARRTDLFTQEWPWRVRLPGVHARYVRLRLEKKAALCLSEVEVFTSPRMADWP